MAHWSSVFPSAGMPVLAVDLADWAEDFDGTLARVLAHLDLPQDDSCTRFHEVESRVRTVSRAQAREAFDARGLCRRRTYAAELAADGRIGGLIGSATSHAIHDQSSMYPEFVERVT